MEQLTAAPVVMATGMSRSHSAVGVNRSLLICSGADGQLGAVLLAARLCVFGNREVSLSVYCTLRWGSADWRVRGID